MLVLVRGAAANDPAAADLWEQMLDQRHRGMSEFAHHLFEGGHIRGGMTEKQAADLLWSLNSPELWELLVQRRKWSTDNYRRWMAKTAIDSLLADTAS